MEARTKIIAAVAVIVMCAAGLVGAGYAYTASTVNDNNSASSEYITLVQGGTGAYDFADGAEIYWDSTDFKDRNGTPADPSDDRLKTRYTLADGVTTTTATGYTLVQIGKPFTLNPMFSATADLPAITISVSGVNFNMPTDPDNAKIVMRANNGDVQKYYVLVADNVFKEITTFPTNTDPAVVSNDPAAIPVVIDNTDPQDLEYKPVSIDIFYGFETREAAAGYVNDHTTSPVAGPDTTILVEASLTFTIDVNEHNAGVLLDASAFSMGVGDEATITATLVGIEGDVVWTASNANVTFPAGAATSKTFTGAAAGAVVVTATVTTDSGVTYTATCTITVVATP